jgi:sphingolipid delta-4 desaturase
VQQLLPFSDSTFKYKALFGVTAQIFMAWLVSDMPWWAVLALAYLVGGTVNHAMTLALHETSHNLAFGAAFPSANRLFGIFVNLPLGIPAFASFQRYHKDHHTHQGEEVLDTDVPTAREGEIFTSTPAKILWVLMQPGFYALRPLLTAPKKPGGWEAANAAAQIAFDAAIVAAWGGKSLAYLIVGTLLGMGLHLAWPLPPPR